MPLHRDIHWIGRQWAVTGHGVQLIDQKLQGFFDIEVSKLWDDVLVEAMHAKDWLNTADFEKALGIARARYPQAPGAETSPRQPASLPAIEPVEPFTPVVKTPEPKPETPKPGIPKSAAPTSPQPASVEPSRAESAPNVAARMSVEPPVAVTPPQPAVAPPVIEPAAPLSQIVKAGEVKRGNLRLGAPEPVTVTLMKRRPVETPPTVAPSAQATSPGAVAPSTPPAPRPPAVERDAPERVVFVKPGVIEPLRAVAGPPTSAASTNAAAEEPSPPPTLFQMRYEGRARFVRPWRVVARKI